MNKFYGDGDVVKKPGYGKSKVCKYGILMVATQCNGKKIYVKCVSFDNEELIQRIKNVKVGSFIKYKGQLNICKNTKNKITNTDAEIILEDFKVLVEGK